MKIWTGFALLSVVLVIGCSRSVRVQRDNYGEIQPDHGTHLIEAKSGGVYRTQDFAVQDSTIVIQSAFGKRSVYNPGGYVLGDFPVTLEFDDVASVTRKAVPEDSLRRRFYVEAGFAYGSNLGSRSRLFSPGLAMFDLGYLRGARFGQSDRRWGYGGTLCFAAGEGDHRLAVRPRVRYRFHPDWAADVSAGLIFSSITNDPGYIDKGFIGGLSLHYSSWLTLKTEMMVRPAYTPGYDYLPDENEVAVYGGIALRGAAGEWTTGVGLGTYAVVMILYAAAVASALGGLN